mmetsp:Transcript_10538/g.25713  ORF Transcript_10538/g.25713 Transcript_10538/m.25713 type:complete len:274 (-) Transcript_10538:382-1203(-)|eukprot:CAMPEP_0178993268 /NCGR_PEP_ID=MMETSP0795-20121207/6610_1 /TAXON_ID=88552 /ORGANISM="Amoebophrya sp., Strain Ameob2" /LENGTH=273 /DNA_ID=CAMNT_0020685311 /DNA_START=316 /DNA_END=1137 /DNA_ORIENTATION=+
MVAFSKFAIGVAAFATVAVTADESIPAAVDIDLAPELKEAVAEVTKETVSATEGEAAASDESTETTTTTATPAPSPADATDASDAAPEEKKVDEQDAEVAELDALDLEAEGDSSAGAADRPAPSAEEIAEVKELLKKLLSGEQVEGAEEKLDQVLGQMPPDVLTEIFQEVFPADMMAQLQGDGEGLGMGEGEELLDLDPTTELSDADAAAMDEDEAGANDEEVEGAAEVEEVKAAASEDEVVAAESTGAAAAEEAAEATSVEEGSAAPADADL